MHGNKVQGYIHECYHASAAIQTESFGFQHFVWSNRWEHEQKSETRWLREFYVLYILYVFLNWISHIGSLRCSGCWSALWRWSADPEREIHMEGVSIRADFMTLMRSRTLDIFDLTSPEICWKMARNCFSSSVSLSSVSWNLKIYI